MAVKAKKINQLTSVLSSAEPKDLDVLVAESVNGKAYKASIKQFNDLLEGLNGYNYNLLHYANMEADGTNDFSIQLTELIGILSTKGGGVIFIPNGKYIINNVTILSNISIIGEDVHNTILYPTGSNSAIIGLNTGNNTIVAPTENIVIKNLTVDGSLQTYTTYDAGIKGIFIQIIKNAIFKDLIIRNTVATGFGCDGFQIGLIQNVSAINCGRGVTSPESPGGSGIGIGTGKWELGVEPLIIDSCVAVGCGQYGIFFETQIAGTHGGDRPYGNIVSNCFATGNRIGFGSSGCTGLLWNNCSADKNKEAGFSTDSGSYNSSTAAYRVALNTTWSNCVSSRNGTGAITGESYQNGNGFVIKGQQSAYGFHFNNCLSLENNADGLCIYNSTANNWINNVFVSGGNYSLNGRHGINLMNNTISNIRIALAFLNKNVKNGMRINANLTNAIIKDSLISENSVGAELVSGKALTNYIFRDNLIYSNTANDLLNIEQN